MQQSNNKTLRFAHSLLGMPDETKWEPLDAHLKAVAALAREFGDAFGLGKWAEAAGLLHDIGKNSEAFLAYIRHKGNSPDHSTAGAVEAIAKYGETCGRLLAFMLAGHHAGLADGKDLTVRLTKKLEPYKGWETHTGALPSLNDLQQLPAGFGRSTQYPGFHFAFLARMVFSCLVDADFLATEQYYAKARGETVERGNYQPLAELRDRLRAHMDGVALRAEGPLKTLRAEILGHAVGKAGSARGLFTMTVPTGGGKTLASLSFALEHAVAHDMKRVIYVAPYTAIIEQTAQVFREALKTNEDILEHHSNFDWDVREDADGQADRDGLKKLQRATENWDAPVIVTTAVQFFESLFAARTGRCRKLHNIANSVIILDEAQTLPLHLLRPCMAALDELARNYSASIVLCTATQPALRLMDDALPLNKKKERQGFDIGPERELAPRPEALYVELKRVNVEVRPSPVDDETIKARFAEQNQMLCILNTRGHAKALFDLIKEQAGARHLTTLMCPAHRRRVLTEIKDDLKNGRHVRLVATSLVEAGVDFSFPEVWRAETGLDSIAQAAGRCNREGKAAPGRVVVFTPMDHKLPKQFTAYRDSARLPLQMRDPLGLEGIKQYFHNLYFKGGLEALDAVRIDDRDGILPAIERTARGCNFPFAEIAQKFQLIAETMRPVIVQWDGGAKTALAALTGDIPPGWAVRKLQQYTVSIPETVWKSFLATGAIQPVNPKLGERFVLLFSGGLYEEMTGLRLDDPTFRSADDNLF